MKPTRMLPLAGALLIGASLLAVGCSSEDAPPIGWKMIDAGSFSIFAPPGWKFDRLQGVDSYVGEFVGDGFVLNFDFGEYSNSLDEDQASYVITYDLIGGLKAKIVRPRTPGHGLTGIYFAKVTKFSLRDSLCLYGNDLNETQQKLASRIFQTIRFKNVSPP